MTEIIPIGPYHPLQEEPEFFRLHVEGETVTHLDIEIGYNHRAIVKVNFLQTVVPQDRIFYYRRGRRARHPVA